MKLIPLTFSALFLQMAFITGAALAAEQSVTPSQVTFSDVKANQEIEFTLIYTTDNINTTGAGVTLYFDSSKLTLIDEPTAVLPDNLIAIDKEAKADSDNKDKDDKTDQRITAAWADFSAPGNWPGKTPADLYTVKFKTSANFTGSSNINLTGKPASGFSINLKNVTITSSAAVKGEEQPVPPPPKKKKSGSMSWLFLMPLMLLGLVRRRLKS